MYHHFFSFLSSIFPQFLATLNTTSSSTTNPPSQQNQPRHHQQQQQKNQNSQNASASTSKVRSTRIEALKCDSRDFPAPKPRKYTTNRRWTSRIRTRTPSSLNWRKWHLPEAEDLLATPFLDLDLIQTKNRN